MARRLDYRLLGNGVIIPTPLYVDDEHLAEIVLGPKASHWSEVLYVFERQGLPKARATVRGLRYMPAVLKFLDRREGIASFEEDYAEDGPDTFDP